MMKQPDSVNGWQQVKLLRERLFQLNCALEGFELQQPAATNQEVKPDN